MSKGAEEQIMEGCMDYMVGNELGYHQLFINRIWTGFLREDRVENAVVVLGNELRVDGGFGEGGALDLLVVDQRGQAWLVEAKFGANLFNSDPVEQLIKYRDGLMKMNPEVIQQRLLSFIRQDSPNRNGMRLPADDLREEFREAQTVEEAIDTWLSVRELEGDPQYIKNQLFTQLKHGTVGLCVLADLKSAPVLQRLETLAYSGPVAYFQMAPDIARGQALFFRGAQMKKAEQFDQLPTYQEYERRFRALYCNSLEGFESLLNEKVRELWLGALKPELERMGLSVSGGNPRSLNISAEIGGRKVVVMQVGCSDADAKTVPEPLRCRTGTGMKVEWSVKDIKKDVRFGKAFIEYWATEFYRLGWRGKGAGRDLGARLLGGDEYTRWSNIMTYRPEEGRIQDFIGRSGEEVVLRAFSKALEDYIAALGERFCDGVEPSVEGSIIFA